MDARDRGVAGYGLATAVWQLMLASLAFNALETAGTIVWATAKQRHVPPELLGRVSSLDWLISIGLLPLSFALTGPVSGAIGAQATLIAGGVIGGGVTLAALLLPGMRSVEGRHDVPPPVRPPKTTVLRGTALVLRGPTGWPGFEARTEHHLSDRLLMTRRDTPHVAAFASDEGDSVPSLGTRATGTSGRAQSALERPLRTSNNRAARSSRVARVHMGSSFGRRRGWMAAGPDLGQPIVRARRPRA